MVCCFGYALQVVVHRSGLYPEGTWWFLGPSEAYIRISPEFIDSGSQLRTVDAQRRRCTFFDERKLKLAETYSTEMCALECRARAIQSRCRCTPFYYLEQGAPISQKHYFSRFSFPPYIQPFMSSGE